MVLGNVHNCHSPPKSPRQRGTSLSKGEEAEQFAAPLMTAEIECRMVEGKGGVKDGPHGIHFTLETYDDIWRQWRMMLSEKGSKFRM